MATIQLLGEIALKTTPKDPSPIVLIILYFSIRKLFIIYYILHSKTLKCIFVYFFQIYCFYYQLKERSLQKQIMLPKLCVYENIRTQQTEKRTNKHIPIQQYRIFNQDNQNKEKKLDKIEKKKILLSQVQTIQQLIGVSLSTNQDQINQSDHQKKSFIIKKPSKNTLLYKKKNKLTKIIQKNSFKPSFQTINYEKYQNFNQQNKEGQINRNLPVEIDNCLKTWKQNFSRFNRQKKFRNNSKKLRYTQQNDQSQKEKHKIIAQSFSFDKSYEHFKKYEDGITIDSLSYNRRIHLKNIKDFLCQSEVEQNISSKKNTQEMFKMNNVQIQQGLQMKQDAIQLQRSELNSDILYRKGKNHSISSQKTFFTNRNILLFKSIQNISKRDLNKNIDSSQAKKVNKISSSINQKNMKFHNKKHNNENYSQQDLTKQYNNYKQVINKKSLAKSKLKLKDIININMKQNDGKIKIKNKINWLIINTQKLTQKTFS